MTQPGLLVTKLHPPPARHQMVVRDRLLERLRPVPGLKLTVVAAPAGCGKTTLLGTWRELEATQRPLAWLTLDEGDNDPVVLWSHVLETLHRECPAVSPSASQELVGGKHLVDVVLPRLVNDLAEHGDVTLVLDDFHRLGSGPARDSLAWLAVHAPSTLQLVLASRNEPALPLATLRAHGELLELHAEELAFTTDEADLLLNGHFELGLAREDVEDLVERTEGWPAGLYLATLSLHGVRDRHAFIRRFGGASRHVIDFLVDEVLEAHDVPTQTLMLRSSILERMCGSLCDAVLEQEGSRELLDELARTNLFLMPMDDVREWYRFHHLFAQLLRVELEHREPGLAPTLHRRAYAWHRDHGSIDEAIEHALEAGAFAEAGELIATAWVMYTNVCRFATVLAWLDRFPAELLREDAQLLLVKAWVLALCAMRDEATQAMAAVEGLGGLDRGPLPDGSSSLEASLATLRATIPWGDVGGGYENAVRAAELEQPQSPFWPVVCWALGMGNYFRGQLEEADRWFAEAARLAPLSEQWLIAGSALAYRSLVAGDRGRVDEQRLLAEQAAQLARERAIEEVDGEVHVALGVSLAARAKGEEALPLLERSVAVLRSFGQPIDLANALICQASVLRALGQREAAAAAIGEARATVDSCPDPGILQERLAGLESSSPARSRQRDTKLSRRELAVLRLLTGSLSERDIGRELYLSHNTVHSHARSIYRKLGVSSRAEAIRQARTLGLL
jgi:LuxR family maltose regulon positive regulatory protein